MNGTSFAFGSTDPLGSLRSSTALRRAAPASPPGTSFPTGTFAQLPWVAVSWAAVLRELLVRIERHAALVQAVSSLASAVVTIVLVGVTSWYAAIARKTLQAIRQERSDRIAAARAPVSNALTIVEETLDEAARTLRAPSAVAEIYQIRNVLGDRMNALSRAGTTISSLRLAKTTSEVASEVQKVALAIPRHPGAYGTELPLDVMAAAAAKALALIPPARRAIAKLRTELHEYIG